MQHRQEGASNLPALKTWQTRPLDSDVTVNEAGHMFRTCHETWSLQLIKFG